MTIALTLVVVVVAGWVACWAMERELRAVVSVVDAMVPLATMRLLFVDGTDDGLVVDGLLDVDGGRIGVPTTWCLTPPRDPALRAIVSSVLETWAATDAVTTVDLTRLSDATPSIALDCEGSHIRLAVARRPSLAGG